MHSSVYLSDSSAAGVRSGVVLNSMGAKTFVFGNKIDLLENSGVAFFYIPVECLE